MINPRPKILDHLASMDYAVFEEGDWNLNIIGVRKRFGTPNKFDDTMVVCYKKNAGRSRQIPAFITCTIHPE